jgi:hypothetical protein
MRNLEQHAKRILEVYLARGQAALDLLRSEKVDDALEALRWRKAAFHNFRVIDSQAQLAGIDLQTIESFAGLLSEIQSVDMHLKEEMIRARDLANVQAEKLHNARRKIGKYRSTVDEPSRFEQSV